MNSKFILSCVLEIVKLFHLHGLATTLIVCDGASTNLSTLKATYGCFGAYPILEGTYCQEYHVNIINDINKIDKSDPCDVSPVMINPFSPPNPILWLICPTHQVSFVLMQIYKFIVLLFKEHDKCSIFIKTGRNQKFCT